MTIIRTNRLLLRPVERGDAPRFAELCNDRSIANNTSRIPHPYTAEDARNFVDYAIQATAKSNEFPFAVCRNDNIIACAGVLANSAKSFELGYWVGADDRGKGIAGEAAAAVTCFAFEKLAATIVTAGYFIGNPASGRVLEKLGFHSTGKTVKTMSLGRGGEVDTIRMELSASDFARPEGVTFQRQ